MVKLWSCEEREENEVGEVIRLYVVAAETEQAAREALERSFGIGGRPRLAVAQGSVAMYALWSGPCNEHWPHGSPERHDEDCAVVEARAWLAEGKETDDGE